MPAGCCLPLVAPVSSRVGSQPTPTNFADMRAVYTDDVIALLRTSTLPPIPGNCTCPSLPPPPMVYMAAAQHLHRLVRIHQPECCTRKGVAEYAQSPSMTKDGGPHQLLRRGKIRRRRRRSGASIPYPRRIVYCCCQPFLLALHCLPRLPAQYLYSTAPLSLQRPTLVAVAEHQHQHCRLCLEDLVVRKR